MENIGERRDAVHISTALRYVSVILSVLQHDDDTH